MAMAAEHQEAENEISWHSQPTDYYYLLDYYY